MSNPETLAEYVSRVMKENNLSTRDVQKASGDRIDKTQVAKIASGQTKRIGVKNQEALADGLGVPREEIFAVVNGTFVRDDYAKRINVLIDDLPAKVKEDLFVMIEALHAKYNQRGNLNE